MPTDPAAPEAPLPIGIVAQTTRVMDNLKVVLDGIGLGLEHVTMARIYLTQFERDYDGLNALWPSFFEAGKLPARTTIGVTALAVGALVEIDLIVRRP
jgi:2-iminobutanoate/2-iminopropanoate deaminase